MGWTAASAYFTAFTTPSTPPAVPSSPNNVAATVVENIALGGQGVLPATLDASLNNQDANKLLTSSSTAPGGGALLTGSQFNVHVGNNVVDIFQLVNGQATITQYDAATGQETNAGGASEDNPTVTTGTYNVTAEAVIGSFSCCFGDAGCTTVPSQQGSAKNTYKVTLGTSLSELTTQSCSAWATATAGSGCGKPGCDCEVGSNSFGCSFSCEVVPPSSACSTSTLTANYAATLQ